MDRVRVGIVGCGNISGIYLTNLTGVFKDIVDLVAVCDIIPERADAAAEKYGVRKKYYTDDDIMADGEIEFIVNLTTPDQHCPVNLMALAAGKHAYCEKPLATNREDGKRQVDFAKERGLLLGGAPDTFLGGGIQTCRKLIEDDWIGTPIGAQAYMLCHGHESWHPDPEFYYQVGGGPMFDMGPYYVTALINLMGAIDNVAGSTRITFPTRTITSQKKYGKIVEVEVPTMVTGLINFKSGAIGTIITTFDVWGARVPFIEIHGSKGSISVPDPNGFGGPILLKRPDGKVWEEVPVVYGYQENSRGLGVADFCCALRQGRAPRCGHQLTYHVLDAMVAFHEASNTKRNVKLTTKFTQPPILPMGLRAGEPIGK